MNSSPPEKIKLHRQSQQLELHFHHSSYFLTAEFLRVHSPSAEVRGHGKGQEVLQLNKQDVAIIALDIQGNYALKISFNDGHNTGLYTWDYLYNLCKNQTELWKTYQTNVIEHKENSQIQAVKWITPSAD